MAGRNGRGGGTATAEKTEKKDPPVWSRKMWTGSANVEVAVFSKVINEGGQGEFTAYNVTARRTWKNDEGYQASASFRSEDCPVLIQLLTQAQAFVTDQLNGRE